MKHRLLWHFPLQLQLLVTILEISIWYQKHGSYIHIYRLIKKTPPPENQTQTENYVHQTVCQKLSAVQFYFQLIWTFTQDLCLQFDFNPAASEPGTTAECSIQYFLSMCSRRLKVPERWPKMLSCITIWGLCTEVTGPWKLILTGASSHWLSEHSRGWWKHAKRCTVTNTTPP